MSESIDSQIISTLMSTLSTVSIANGYNTNVSKIELPRSVVRITQYPYLLVIPNEVDVNSEYGSLQDGVLPILLWYFDGISDDDESVDPFTWRLRNVVPDLTKAIKADPTMGGLAQNVRVTNWNYGIFADESMFECGVFMFIEIDRIVDSNDPYQLAG